LLASIEIRSVNARRPSMCRSLVSTSDLFFPSEDFRCLAVTHVVLRRVSKAFQEILWPSQGCAGSLLPVGRVDLKSVASTTPFPKMLYSHSLRSFHSESSVPVGFRRGVDAASRRATSADMRSHRKTHRETHRETRIVCFTRGLLLERA
jgi:hypothetical protein